MALPSNYRWVVVGKLAIRNRAKSPSYAPNFNLVDLINAMKDRKDRGDHYRMYSRNSKIMWCENVDKSNDYYKLIIQLGDKNVTGVSFLHFDTKKTRDISKELNEGSHYAAHVLIKKSPDKTGRHLILIEKVPGLHLSSVKDHLTWIFKNPLYEKSAKDDDGKDKSFRPVFEIEGHQSKTIREALRTGVLQDIEFISYEENHDDGLDEDPIIEDVVHEARWEVKKKVTEDQAKTVFTKVGDFFKKFRDGDGERQIFVRIKADNGQIRRTEVHHNGDEILEQAFVQNEIVSDFDPPLPPRYEDFRQDMIRKMVEVAKNVGD
ncbi:hypothetical protein [Albimonas pacifica]|uniref:hypothetical protein n=1 Tax=Albimonas pacifica TaxID=1114924 RepID=UPI001160E050|nr:hypothetical protein [Albimonas pacifica]